MLSRSWRQPKSIPSVAFTLADLTLKRAVNCYRAVMIYVRGLTNRVICSPCLVFFGHQTNGVFKGENGEVFLSSVQMVQA